MAAPYDHEDGSMEGNSDTAAHEMAAEICAKCNDAAVTLKKSDDGVDGDGDGDGGDDGGYIIDGQPTEAALLVLARKLAGFAPEENVKKVAKLEFNRSRKSMGVISTTNGANTLYVKGAPENVLERCSHVLLESGRRVKLTAAMRRNINAEWKACRFRLCAALRSQ